MSDRASGMRLLATLLIAVVSASLAPAVAFALWLLVRSGGATLSFLPLVLAAGSFVSFLHVLVLGLPAAGWLLKVGRFHLLPMLLLGFFAGSLPAFLWRTSRGMVSPDALPDDLAFTGFAGVLGSLGSAVFFLVFWRLGAGSPFEPMPAGSRDTGSSAAARSGGPGSGGRGGIGTCKPGPDGG